MKLTVKVNSQLS